MLPLNNVLVGWLELSAGKEAIVEGPRVSTTVVDAILGMFSNLMAGEQSINGFSFKPFLIDST